MLAIRAVPLFALALAAPACADATADLFAAAKGETVAEVQAALSAGANPGARNELGMMPLHLAAAENADPSVITTLIEGGADPNARSEFGKISSQTLHEAAELLDGVTPLHWAAAFNPNPLVIMALLKGGADPGARTKSGITPLHLAVGVNADPSVIEALIEGGADPNARIEFGKILGKTLHEEVEENPALSGFLSMHDGATPLHLAAEGNENPSVIVALIESGADPGARTKSGMTPLHVAATTANPSVITALLEAGADPGARDEWGKTPFGYAEDNEALRGTDTYWRLNDGRFE